MNTLQFMDVFAAMSAQNWVQYSRRHLTSAEERQVIMSLDLLAKVLLLNPRMLLASFATKAHCWLLCSLWSTKTPSPFQESC